VAGIASAIVGSLLIAALNTFGDFVWARFIPAHSPLFGLLHGTVLCLGIGLYLGALRGRSARGAAGGAAIGLAAAGGYYALAALIGYVAMFLSWMALWVAFALLNEHGLGEPGPRAHAALVRGVLAALGSGFAFYAVSGIWTRPPPGGPDYGHHFLCWTAAFLPGFVALLARRAGARAAVRT
jgi:hypothetical protein